MSDNYIISFEFIGDRWMEMEISPSTRDLLLEYLATPYINDSIPIKEYGTDTLYVIKNDQIKYFKIRKKEN